MGAVRTLEVVVVHNHDFGVGIPAHGPSPQINLLHHLCKRILTQVHLGEANKRLLVLGEEEVVVLLAALVLKRHGQGVIAREIARMHGRHRDFYAGGKFVSEPQLPLNLLAEFIRGLGRAAETN